MVDEKIVIRKLEIIKDNSKKIMNKSHSIMYMSQDQFCYLIDYIIKYIDSIKAE